MADDEGGGEEMAANPLSNEEPPEEGGAEPAAEALSNDEARAEESGSKIARFAALLLLQILVDIGFSIVYTELGYGATIYRFLGMNHHIYTISSTLCVVMFLLLYLFDFRYWAHSAAAIPVGLAVLFAFILSATFIFKKMPHAPVAIFYVGVPLVYGTLHMTVFKNVHLHNYMMSMSAVLVVTGLICSGVALAWANEGEHGFGVAKHKGGFFWGPESKLEFRARLRICDMSNCSLYTQQNDAGQEITAEAYLCPEVATTMCETYGGSGVKCLCLPEHEIEEDSACTVWREEADSSDVITKVYEEHCLAAFMLWACPFIGSALSLVFGIICFLLAGTIDEAHTADATKIHPGTKIFVYIMVLGILMVYTAASIAGASMKAASLVTTFSFLTVAICVVVIAASIGRKAMSQALESIPIVAKLQEAGHSDFLKAVVLMVFGPPSLIYFFLSFLNQFFRRTLPCTKDVEGDESKLILTQTAHNQLDAIKHWNWTSVLSKVVGVGFFYFIFSVGVAKFTNLGLSALNAALAQESLATVTFVFWLVGFAMFLLPPVPGIPVYLTGGIVLANSAMKNFCDPASEVCADDGSGSMATSAATGGLSSSFWLGVLYGSFWSCIVKACAILAQQKVIGGQMGQMVAVRRVVGVNSLTIRTIKRILEQPGLPLSKVAILVGGPDWPTSVLTGILNLSYFQMLVGSSPFLVTISVTVLAGALMLKAGESPALGAAAATMLFVASLVQMACLFAAMTAIQSVATKYEEEIMSEPPDQEVLASEVIVEKAQKARNKVTHWSVLPTWVKGLLTFEALLMYVSIIMFRAGDCFVPVEVTTDIEEPPLYGEPMRLVKSLGRIGVAVHFTAVLLHQFVYGRWVADEVADELAKYNGKADMALAAIGDDEARDEEEEAFEKKREATV